MSGLLLAKKILRERCYWLRIENDCFKHVHKCHLCQIYVDKINPPPALLHNMTSLWPFSMWRVGAIGMIHQKLPTSTSLFFWQSSILQMGRSRLVRKFEKSSSEALHKKKYRLLIWFVQIYHNYNAKNLNNDMSSMCTIQSPHQKLNSLQAQYEWASGCQEYKRILQKMTGNYRGLA